MTRLLSLPAFCSQNMGIVLSFEKKFLSAIEDQLLNKDGDSRLPQATHERMRDTLSHLCYHYGRLPGGECLRNSWQKAKYPDEPQDVSLNAGLHSGRKLNLNCFSLGIFFPRNASRILSSRPPFAGPRSSQFHARWNASSGYHSSERDPTALSACRGLQSS